MITLTHDELVEVIRTAFLEGMSAQQGTHLYANDRFMLEWAKQYAERITKGEEA